MGVNSLWKVLDEARCGKPVGIKEIQNGSSTRDFLAGVNPWNFNRNGQEKGSIHEKKQTLAVDLSIWICESLSSGIADNHSHPAIHLVFTRTIKLLSLGVGLVFVVEGKRRIRDAGITMNDEADKFRKRRSGTSFWKACRDCHDMLLLMGVKVVRAKAEGEALCALLNQRGIVDGVISNDGDCLLFGAKVIYTKFSIDNLENNRVMRYDAKDLCAVDTTGDDVANTDTTRCSLSRQDLVAFAVLTGSDLAGAGLDNVGHKKAVRFIRKCQLDNPVKSETAAIEELQSWARSIAPCERDPFDQEPALLVKSTGKCCSRCSHGGSKTDHLKNGCEKCGTEPGELCFECTSDDRFRLGLRAKALALFPKFDPSQVLDAYMRPNDNLTPTQFMDQVTPKTNLPDLKGLMKMKFIVKGRSLETSRDFIKNAVGRILSRAELEHSDSKQLDCDDRDLCTREPRYKPVPLAITKATIVRGVPSYHINWSIFATISDENGQGIDEYQYTTVEPQGLVQKRFPNLVKKFVQAEKDRLKQGEGEQKRRRAFLASLWTNLGSTDGEDDKNAEEVSPRKKRDKKRLAFFEQEGCKRPALLEQQFTRSGGDDASQLRRCVDFRRGQQAASQDSSIESVAEETHSASMSPSSKGHSPPGRSKIGDQAKIPLSPVYCHFGSFLIPITPIDAMLRGEYPPKRIYVRQSHRSGAGL